MTMELDAAARQDRRGQQGGPGSSSGATKIRYQPGLDGLRGLCALAVLLYHAGFDWARGGYFGVDAFFVLSGYLITSLLLAEQLLTGRIDVKQFWGRRARRLLPALFLVVAVITVVAPFTIRPHLYGVLRGDVLATLFYVANWELIARGSSYFNLFVTSPLKHAWSLAIEEQWYLVWPLLVIAVMRYGSRGRRSEHAWELGRRRLVWVSAALAISSAALMAWLWEPHEDPSRLYFGTDTRAQSILAGATLGALLSQARGFSSGRARGSAVAAGAVALVSTLALWSQAPEADAGSWIYRGGFLLSSSLVSICILGVIQPGVNPLRTLLGWLPLRWLGWISYGLYLWHWPVYLLADYELTGIDDPGLLLTFQWILIFGISVISYRVLELPIRRGALRAKVALALVPTTIAVLIVVLYGATRGATKSLSDLAAEAKTRSQEPAMAALEVESPPGAAAPTKVLMVGDSVAWSLGLGFSRKLQEEAGILFVNYALPFCQLSGGETRVGTRVHKALEGCADWRREYLKKIDTFDPDLVILMPHSWDMFDRKVDGKWLSFAAGALDDLVLGTFQEAIDILSSGGATVLLPTSPYFGDRPGKPVEFTLAQRPRVDHFNDLLRVLALRNPETTRLLEFAAFMCPQGECQKKRDGIEVRADGLHFNPGGGAKLVAAWLAPQLRKIGLQQRRGGNGAPAEAGNNHLKSPPYE